MLGTPGIIHHPMFRVRLGLGLGLGGDLFPERLNVILRQRITAKPRTHDQHMLANSGCRQKSAVCSESLPTFCWPTSGESFAVIGWL